MKIFIIIGLMFLGLILVVAPIVLIIKNLHDNLMKPAYERTINRIKNLIPEWIRGK